MKTMVEGPSHWKTRIYEYVGLYNIPVRSVASNEASQKPAAHHGAGPAKSHELRSRGASRYASVKGGLGTHSRRRRRCPRAHATSGDSMCKCSAMSAMNNHCASPEASFPRARLSTYRGQPGRVTIERQAQTTKEMAEGTTLFPLHVNRYRLNASS
jgi:hypothetical protein